MKILLLCDRVPDGPGDGLLLRVVNLARQLAGSHDIDLVCFRSGQGRHPVPGLFKRTWTVNAPPTRPPAGWLGPLGGWGPDALYAPCPELTHLLSTAIDPADYDVVWDAGAVLFVHLPERWSKVPLVADLVDDMVLTFRRAMHSAPTLLGKLRQWKYSVVFGRFERSTMSRVDHCVVVSDEDAASFAQVSPRVPVSVIPNGVDAAAFVPAPALARPGHLVFEGTMGFPPNEQAAVHLVENIMPLVWAQAPAVTLSLVGRGVTPVVQALASDRVEVTGEVADVRAHVCRAQVFVCPLVSGAGIKNKLLQAWAMGLPTVATPISVGGLGARDEVELLVRQSPQAFASAVLELLADEPRRQRLAAAARAAAVDRFAWAAMGERFEGLLQESIEQRRVAAARLTVA
jgi:polysaccharide biosynthesis protein PslH